YLKLVTSSRFLPFMYLRFLRAYLHPVFSCDFIEDVSEILKFTAGATHEANDAMKKFLNDLHQPFVNVKSSYNMSEAIKPHAVESFLKVNEAVEEATLVLQVFLNDDSALEHLLLFATPSYRSSVLLKRERESEREREERRGEIEREIERAKRERERERERDSERDSGER
ncbi:hypothetical protein DPMN_054984, partial [Dreissena polymorpha]